MPNDSSMILPGPDDRTLIIGRTGSGKSHMALWMLSEVHQSDDVTIIIDFKRDTLISQVPYTQDKTIFDDLPREPGLYRVQPFPQQQKDISDFLMRVWDTENIRLFIDEGVMLAKNDALDNILIQGRSKMIPVIMLTQRPVGISRFAFSESQIFVVFPSHDKRERKTINEFTPLFDNGDNRPVSLPPYHSYYYNVTTGDVLTLAPVPSIDKIMRTFEEKLRPIEPGETVEPPRRLRRIVPI